MEIVVNGEPRDIAEGATLSDLLRQLNVALERCAVERNLEVVRRQEWAHTLLAAGDKLEIVHFVGGG